MSFTKTGGLGFGFQTMPYLFQQWGGVFSIIAGVFFFGLLFFAGITSSLAMGTPCMGFMQDEFGWSRQKAAWAFGATILILGLPTVLYFNEGVFDEYDYWAGDVSLVIFALFEIILFAWVFGMKRGWDEMNEGADIKIPSFMKLIIQFISPLIIGFIFVMSLPDLWKNLSDFSSTPKLVARLLLLALWIAIAWLVRIAYYRRKREGRYINQELKF